MLSCRLSLRRAFNFLLVVLLASPVVVIIGCSGSGSPSSGGNPKTNYTITVASQAPSSGVAMTATPADYYGNSSGTTSFNLVYVSGTTATVTAPTTSGSNKFVSWSGCTSATANVCTVSVTKSMTITALYNAPTVTGITVTPNTATIGSTVQFAAQVSGTGAYSSAVTWSVTAPTGWTGSVGTINASTGAYITPYPAPATVTVTATSTQTPSVSGNATVALNAPATSTGPALTIDAGTVTRAISPLIYGLNAYALDSTSATNANISVTRWGGDSTSRYNYENGNSSDAADWYFENAVGTGVWPTGQLDDTVTATGDAGITLIGTVPVLGWVANGTSTACGFSSTLYPNQQSFDPYRTNPSCGNGKNSDGSNITGNDPTVTSIKTPPPVPPGAGNATTAWAAATWSGGWQQHILNKFGAAIGGKAVAVWDLDNEPSWWYATHRDVHPAPFTYDEDTNGSIGTALALKTIDPTVETAGPVMDFWYDYFYSMKDITSGWSTGPCWEPWSNPVDRNAHSGVPFIEYYLQQFKAADTTYGKRLLDYVTLHTYAAAYYNGNPTGLTTAGDTAEQIVRLNSTRVFWDPTYTDPNFPQPNYTTDSNYTSSCSTPLQAPQLVRMMRQWVATDYPGTKTSIDEYNFGGLESINGAVTQGDILGIFGREGLDMATLWPTTDFNQTVPGLMAFTIYRNYDGAKSTFGDQSLASTSTLNGGDGEGTLAVYGARRTKDSALTIMVINKSYGPLTSAVSIENFSGATSTAVYQYSAANLNAITAQAASTITPPTGGGTTSTLSYTFPGQSMTLFVIP